MSSSGSTSSAGVQKMGSVEEEGDVFDDSLKERRLVIIGKTGNGKSSIGNLLLGSNHFRVGFSMLSTTVHASSSSASFHGWKIKVIDTPDISNVAIGSEDQAQCEVTKWKAMASPTAHAILLAVRCDVRYTHEEHEIFLQLKKLWGGQSLCRRLIVAFTFGDRQDSDLKEDLKKVCPELKSVLKDASQRYILFNDKDSDEAKQDQVHRLMEMVDVLEDEVVKEEERRLLTGVQVCPMGPVPQSSSSKPPLRRTSSEGSRGSRSSSSTDANYIKLLLVGRPGTGKSSTGNTIVGRPAFVVNQTSQTDFHNSSMTEVFIDGQHFQVIDTPGLRTASEDKEYVQARRRASELVMPGPHALLFVVRYNNITEEDLTGFRTFKKRLGQGLSHHTVIVLVGAPPGLASSNPSDVSQLGQGAMFLDLLREAGNKLWMVNNKDVEADARQQQVKSLMGVVRRILDNSGGNCFHGDKAAGEFRQKKDKDKAQRSSCWFL